MSYSNLLVGTPALINPALIPGGVVADTINGLTGDIAIVGGTGISVPAPVGQNITVNNTGVLSVAAVPNSGVSATTVAGATTLSLNFADGAAEALVREVDQALVSTVNTPYTAPADGPYVVRISVISANDAGVGGAYSWVQGTDQVNVVVFINGFDSGDAGLCVNSLVSATPPGASFNTFTNIVVLNAGDVVTASVGSLGAPNLGNGGNVAVFIAPLFL